MIPQENAHLRYACQMVLPGFNVEAQQKLANAKVLLVGAGGLGCPAAQYLTAAGIGSITIVDDDVISAGNLHRQILYAQHEIGRYKATIAAEKLQLQNPFITITAIVERVGADNVMELVRHCDIVVDGTDNFDTRYLLNDACYLLQKPLVYGAIYQYEGQVAVWNIATDDGKRTPHYRDVFPSVDATMVPNCAEGGVLPTIAGIIGCMQANEVIKYITGIGEILAAKLLILDVQTLQSRIIQLQPTSHTVVTALQKPITAPEINIATYKANITQYFLVDIRTSAERAVEHMGGVHLPMENLKANPQLLDQQKPVLLYCASGKRSYELVKILQQVISPQLYSLKGGMKAWMEAKTELP